MHINKKLVSIAVTTLLVLSIVAAATPVFAVTANPTLDVTNGPVETKVTVSGGPGEAEPFGSVTIYWDSTSGTVLGTAAVGADGSYSAKVIIPSATTTTATNHHYIVVDDGNGAKGTEFTVEPSVEASTVPKTSDTTHEAKVLPGDALTITGHGFAGSTSTTKVKITLKLDSTTLATPKEITFPAENIETNATGSFQATVIIPTSVAVDEYDTYTVTVTDDSADATSANTKLPILIGYYAAVSPTQAPVGVTATISGRIPKNADYSITLSGSTISTTTIGTGTADGMGAFSNDYKLPSLLGSGDYKIAVRWSPTVEPVQADLKVTAAPTANILEGYSGVAGQVFTIKGENFVKEANMTLYFDDVVVNSTNTDARFKASNDKGVVENKFAVPALSPGVYTVTLKDQYGASAETIDSFTIKAAAVTVANTRADSYVQGDIVSFNIYSTDDKFDDMSTSYPLLSIKAPGGYFWYKVVLPVERIGNTYYVLYEGQVDSGSNHFVLPADAPTGTWNWTLSFYDTLGTHDTSATNWKTGTFTVGTGGTSGIIGAIDSIKDDIAIIKTSVGTTLSADVSSIKGTVTSIQNSIATLSIPDLGTITTKLTDIDSVLAYVAGDVATISSTIGTFDATLDSINTKVTSIEGGIGGIATIQTDLGTLQGTVTSISGNVATIQTSIGTLQADVSGLQGDMSSLQNDVGDSTTATGNLTPLIIVAIVLALIAAIAAIASIVLMRRKIAG
jgi:hypothetical protein